MNTNKTQKTIIPPPTEVRIISSRLKAVSLSVFLAVGVLNLPQAIAFPSLTSFVQNGDVWGFKDKTGDFSQTFLVKVGNDQKPVYQLITGKADPYDNSEAWIWSTSEKSTPSTLFITVNASQPWNIASSGKYEDTQSSTMWIAAGLRSYFGKSRQEIGSSQTVGDNYDYSKTTNGNTLNLALASNVTFMGKFFGARNDIGGGKESQLDSSLVGVGNANENTVNISLDSNSLLYAKLIFGGRSAQLDGINGERITNEKGTFNAIHRGFETNNNKVFIRGTLKGTLEDSSKASNYTSGNKGDSSLLIVKGIFGGEGYESSKNLVSVKDTLLVAGTSNARKLGLVGGRGDYYQRINDESVFKNGLNSSVVYGPDGLTDSGIANNNIVLIDNSFIGFSYKNDWTKNNTYAFSIFGGWSTGVSKDNIVSVKNSVINGNVFGALELQDQLEAVGSLQDGKKLRTLNPNLVSLFNVKLSQGYAVYGTATAEGELEVNQPQGEPAILRLNEGSLKAVNRRRGIVYFAGENEADSVYAQYVHFGQYVDNSTLENAPETLRQISRDYYPTSANYQDVLNNPDYKVEDSTALKRIDSNNKEASQYQMQLGDLVAKTYVVNRTGFHSSLASTDPSNISTVTNGMHNFWVGSYVNLVGRVEGDGALFNKDNNDLFADKTKYTVNHTYGNGDNIADQNLSLLVHDDGMIYDYSPETGDSVDDGNDANHVHRPSLMHNFRYHYDGLVLYTGVNTGVVKDNAGSDKKINAVAISFAEIEKFRDVNDEDLDAFGNTFVGVFMEGNLRPFFKPSAKDGFNSLDPNVMTFEPTTVDGAKPFDIYQEGKIVAKATYGFYKYLHFDGTDAFFSDGTNDKVFGKVTEAGKSGGVGVKYWLKSLEILDGQNLVLNGTLKDSVLGTTTSIKKQERYTLSAELTGKGNLEIAGNSTVVLGSPKTIYTILPEEGGKTVKYKKAQPNSYEGVTTVRPGAQLVAGIDGAFGSETRYTSQLLLTQDENKTVGSSVYLQNHNQHIGYLNISKLSKLELSEAPKVLADPDYKPYMGEKAILTIHNGAEISGTIFGNAYSQIIMDKGLANISSDNPEFKGTFDLQSAVAKLNSESALVEAEALISKGSTLYFNTSSAQTTRALSKASATFGKPLIRAINNSGDVFLSIQEGTLPSSVNYITISGNYVGNEGSNLHYRGLLQGDSNSSVDVVRVEGQASGKSAVLFSVFPESRGEKTTNGVLIFSAKAADKAQTLTMDSQPRVVDKDNEGYEWVYALVSRDDENGENGGRNWYLVNEKSEIVKPKPDVPDVPDVPPLPDGPVLRPEAGAYVGASQSWGKMHMRLHDRFGQAYYIDPFSGEEKPAAAWLRQVGSHSHFRVNGGESKSHSRTAVTQLGGDLIRNEINEDWKYIGGVFTGGLYNRTNSKSWFSAKSRTDGYAVGIYGTLYTGNSPDDGFYVDSWLLYGRYDNKVWGDQRPTFKFKSHGWVWSVESGYTIPIGESGTKDYNKVIWTFQPEVQVVWDGVKADSVTDSTGTRYKHLGTDNVAIRVGARLHANYMNKGLGFIEGNWIHNTKKAGVEMSGSKVYMDGGRNLGEFRMGMEGHITKNTLGWATVGAQFGKSGYHNETAQIGIKYMF